MTSEELAPEASPPRHSLPVLPSSGKIEQLQRELQADRANASTSPQPIDRAPSLAADPNIHRKLLHGKVIAALQQIYDPEIPVNIYELGLIYDIAVGDDDSIKVKMTLTAPACPVAGSLPGEVERKIETIPEVKSADVELVWDPPWTRDRMSEAAQLDLGLF